VSCHRRTVALTRLLSWVTVNLRTGKR